MDHVTVEGVRLSVEAARNCEYAGVSPADDLDRLRSGEITRDELLAECLDGAEEQDVIAGWHEYVTDLGSQV